MKQILLLMPLLLLLIACNSSETNHGHTHDEDGLQSLAYTIYSEKTELFVEFKPLVVGSTSKFAAHFTILGEVFTPLTEGNVTVSLVIGNKGIRNSSEKASSPGIFRLSLNPTQHGTGKLIFDINTKNYKDKIVIDNVIVYPDKKTALEQLNIEGKEGDITYLKEQAWKVEFANEEIKRQTFHEIIKTSGQILPAPGDEVILTANSAGVVFFSGTKTIVGSEVNTSTSLFVISGNNNIGDNIDVNFKEAKANYEKSKADYKRASELIQEKIISEKEFLLLKTEFEKNEVIYKNIAKNYTTEGKKIVSPINGYVKNVLVKEGQYVNSGMPLATISKNKKLLLQADLSQKYFPKIPSISAANFVIIGNESVYNTDSLNGKVVSYGKSTSVNSPFIPITFEIDNVGDLIPGSVAEIYLQSNAINDALLIPVSAIIEEQGNKYVFVQITGESFEKRMVEIVGSNGKYAHVINGVKEGERIVTKGAYNIKLSTASGTMPAHGHEH